MARQESSSNSETPPALRRTFLQSTIASLRLLFVFSKTLPFIGGLVVSYKYVNIGVVSTLMDYLLDSIGENDLIIAAVISNIPDVLSSIAFVFISLISEAYTGSYTAITICAAASIEGLMLLWTSASSSFGVFYAAIFLLAIGDSGKKLVEGFYENYLQERIKEKRQQDEADVNAIVWNICRFAPSVVAYIMLLIIIIFVVNIVGMDYEQSFRFAALLTGGTYLFFLFGSVWYKPKELNLVESNLHKIYRICRAAFGNRKEKYPSSLDFYYWKDYKQGHGYEFNKGQRLLPRVPRLFRWLDKAAIVNAKEESNDVEASLNKLEKSGKLCTAKEVREVKSLVPMIYLGLFIFPCSLLMATGNTFFVAQANSMTLNITGNGNDIIILFFIKDVMTLVPGFIFIVSSFAFQRLRKFKATSDRSKRKAVAIIGIDFGMVCAVICSFIAWRVELHKLSLPFIIDGEGDLKRGKITALVPQFIMLGMTEGLVDAGFASLFRDNVAKSMWSFEDSYTKLVIGTGKFLIIPLVLIFHNWFKESVNTSHLNRFYMLLAILNAAFIPIFAYYSIRYAYKQECPQDEQVTMEDHQHPDLEDHSNQEDNNEANLGNQASMTVSTGRTEDEKIEVEQTSDHESELKDSDPEDDNEAQYDLNEEIDETVAGSINFRIDFHLHQS